LSCWPDKGFFPKKDLETLNRNGSHYIGHPTRDVYGVEQNTGALGHGLAVDAGICLGRKNGPQGLSGFRSFGATASWPGVITVEEHSVNGGVGRGLRRVVAPGRRPYPFQNNWISG
jgi:hypothetical protein